MPEWMIAWPVIAVALGILLVLTQLVHQREIARLRGLARRQSNQLPRTLVCPECSSNIPLQIGLETLI